MSYQAHKEVDEATGVTLIVESDSDLSHPYEDDEGVKIVVLHGRYVNPCPEFSTPDEVAAFEAANAADDSAWFTIPLWMYDHSGTAYRVGEGNPFSCPWDSGRVGIIALKRSEWGGGNEGADKLREYAQGVAESYTDYANGNGFEYVVQDSSGGTLDSCGDFLGDYDREGGALDQGRDVFRHHVAEALKVKAAALEAERPDLYA